MTTEINKGLKPEETDAKKKGWQDRLEKLRKKKKDEQEKELERRKSNL